MSELCKHNFSIRLDCFHCDTEKRLEKLEKYLYSDSDISVLERIKNLNNNYERFHFKVEILEKREIEQNERIEKLEKAFSNLIRGIEKS